MLHKHQACCTHFIKSSLTNSVRVHMTLIAQLIQSRTTERDLGDFLHTDKLPVVRDMLLMAVPGTAPSGPLEFSVDSIVSSISHLMSDRALDEASSAGQL